jgi:hypothetical protein
MNNDNDYVTSRQFKDFVREQKEHNERVERSGDERGEHIQEIYRKMDSVDRWRVRADVLINKYNHTLFGNGEPGMDEMLRNVKGMLDVLVKLAWIVVGVVVASGISFLIAIARYFIRTMP